MEGEGALYVGIDLGTTQTAAAVAEANADGILQWKRLPILQPVGSATDLRELDLLPSVVWLGDDSILTGTFPATHAQALKAAHPGSHLIRAIKREMGNIAWTLETGSFRYRPFHIAALILATVRRALDTAYPGRPIARLTITIPASFSSVMRRETLRAARLAGFAPERTQLRDEPLAAFVSLLVGRDALDLPDPATVMVFDMGGGTLDTSVIRYSARESTLVLCSTSRYNEVAGDDLDLQIAALLLRVIRKMAPSINRETVEGFGLGLLKLGEETKLALSDVLAAGPRRGSLTDKIRSYRDQGTVVTVDPTARFPGLKLEPFPVPVADVLEALLPFFDERDESATARTIYVPIRQAMATAGVDFEGITRVFLTGGSSQFPLVQDTIRALFHEFTLLDPFHAVATGALVLAANPDTGHFALSESVFENLYLQRKGNQFLPVLEAPIPVPTKGQSLVWRSVVMPRGAEAVRLPEGRRRARFDFFRGVSVHDPAMSVAHACVVDLPEGVAAGAPIQRIDAALDGDKLLHCRLFFESPTGEKAADVQLWRASRTAASGDDHLPSKVKLNGADI